MDDLEDMRAAARKADDEESVARREQTKLQAEFTANVTNMMTGIMAIRRDLANSMKEDLTAIKDM